MQTNGIDQHVKSITRVILLIAPMVLEWLAIQWPSKLVDTFRFEANTKMLMKWSYSRNAPPIGHFRAVINQKYGFLNSRNKMANGISLAITESQR